jgi:hypothetical protein
MNSGRPGGLMVTIVAVAIGVVVVADGAFTVGFVDDEFECLLLLWCDSQVVASSAAMVATPTPSSCCWGTLGFNNLAYRYLPWGCWGTLGGCLNIVILGCWGTLGGCFIVIWGWWGTLMISVNASSSSLRFKPLFALRSKL